MKTRFFSALQITDDDDDDDDDVDVLKNLFMLPARRSLRFIGDASDVFLEDVEALRIATARRWHDIEQVGAGRSAMEIDRDGVGARGD